MTNNSLVLEMHVSNYKTFAKKRMIEKSHFLRNVKKQILKVSESIIENPNCKLYVEGVVVRRKFVICTGIERCEEENVTRIVGLDIKLPSC